MTDTKRYLDRLREQDPGPGTSGPGQKRSPYQDFLEAHQGQPPYKSVKPKYPGGTANYLYDSYGVLRDRMAPLQGQAGPAGSLADLLASFGGSQKNLRDFLSATGPFLAAQVAQTPEWEKAQRGDRVDLLQQYGVGAGSLGKTGASASAGAAMNLNRSGLGRSGALAGIQSQIAQQVGGDQANIFTNLYLSQLEQQQQLAQQRLDNQMHLAALMGGHNPAMPQGAGGTTSLAPAIGSLAMGIGSIIGGFSAGRSQGSPDNTGFAGGVNLNQSLPGGLK